MAPGATAEVVVTLDANGLAPGRAGGYVTATGDGVSVHAPVGLTMDVEHHDVTVNLTDRHGKTPRGLAMIIHGMDNDYWQSENATGLGSRTYSLPVGRYSVEGMLTTASPHSDAVAVEATDVFALPEINVTDRDQMLTVDGTKATDLTARITSEKRPLEDAAVAIQISRNDGAGKHSTTIADSDLLNMSETKIGAIPSEKAVNGELRVETFLTRREPIVRLSVTSPSRAEIPLKSPAFAKRFAGTERMSLVDAGAGSAEDFASIEVKGKAVLITAVKPSSVDEQVGRAAAAGAVAVIVAPTTPGTRSTGARNDLTIPLAATDYDNGRKLLSLIDRGRGSAHISLSGVQESRYAYSATYTDSGQVPASMAKTVDARDFAKIRNVYRTDGAMHLGRETLAAWAPGQTMSVRTNQFVNMGNTRDDYVLANGTTEYKPNVYAGLVYKAMMAGPRVTYDTPGKRYEDVWFAAPTHPSPVESTICSFCWSDTWARTTSVVGADSEPTHIQTGGPTTTWSYFRDGHEYPSLSKSMTAAKADYRLVMELNRAEDYPGITLGGKIRTEFGFSAAGPTAMAVTDCGKYIPKPTVCESMPVVVPGYDVPLDDFNQARAGKPFAFDVTGHRATGSNAPAAMAGAEVSVSYDDGATWKSAKVHRTDGNSFRAMLLHPRVSDTNGFVGIKTVIRDEAGNRTVQTITRAYALR